MSLLPSIEKLFAAVTARCFGIFATHSLKKRPETKLNKLYHLHLSAGMP
jgi:hypothetical protein